MNLLGLTGGIGMGKSTAANYLSERGLPVVDTDDLSREIVKPGQPALKQIQEIFGADVIDPGGELRREELARRVFSDATKRRQLESILHPRIRELWQARIGQWQLEGHSCAVVVIPLLFETQAEAEFNRIICVGCSLAMQRKRLESRGWSLVEIERRNCAQLSLEQKLARSHFVIWNEADELVLYDQLDRLLKQMASH